MNQREQAAWELHTFFSELGIAYVVIGGMAVQCWGEPRFTQDVDVTVASPLDEPGAFLERIVERFQPRMADAVTFARKHRVLLVQASNGCPVDISLGLPGYEDEVMARAVDFDLAPRTGHVRYVVLAPASTPTQNLTHPRKMRVDLFDRTDRCAILGFRAA